MFVKRGDGKILTVLKPEQDKNNPLEIDIIADDHLNKLKQSFDKSPKTNDNKVINNDVTNESKTEK